MKRRLIIFAVAALVAANVYAQPVPDTEFKPPIEKPAYSQGAGPVVMIDEAHHNWHTATGRYLPFADLLRRDGYVVQASKSPFSIDALKQGNILVIANALNKRNDNYWVPPYPSAFTDEEIKAVHDWVQGGGSLLLIADHLPWPAAADKLASAFGVHYSPVTLSTKRRRPIRSFSSVPTEHLRSIGSRMVVQQMNGWTPWRHLPDRHFAWIKAASRC